MADALHALTLVSHSEFERGLKSAISESAETTATPIALFAARELDSGSPYFGESGEIDAVGRGSDLGSEARVASLIRNLARADDKFLNHPSVEAMRRARCRTILMVDDFIGSGQRISDFFDALWSHPSLRSWHSLGLIQFGVAAYSATEDGLKRVSKLKTSPTVTLHRECPTFHNMPWRKNTRDATLAIFKKHGSLGFKGTAAAIVFEHGCPNNCPSVFWAKPTKKRSWPPVFPEKSVNLDIASAFPPEIVRRDPAVALALAGQPKLAKSGALQRRGPVGALALTVIGLAARGVRKRTSIAYATGLSIVDTARLLDRCVKWGYLTLTYRVTDAGLSELNYAKKDRRSKKNVPPRGEDIYYPNQLRRPAHG
ncbi:hypothetical protein NOJ17_09505 [Neorhizobium galegae]|nr:hypothetical protein [Neorhizobium galegae]MCQ1835160.1 hypothetical protein [Neorhizobium galegae]